MSDTDMTQGFATRFRYSQANEIIGAQKSLQKGWFLRKLVEIREG
jgi:hypothetical protein